MALPSRDQAWQLVEQHISKPETRYHLRESEVIMRALAQKLGQDEELWGLTGLLHDLDWELVADDVSQHGTKTVAMLHENGISDPAMENAILAHVEGMGFTDKKRESQLDFALAAAESLSGFVVAVARVRPDGLTDMKPKSISKKLKDKSFAANCNREFINDIEKAGVERGEFFALAIAALQNIKDEIDL